MILPDFILPSRVNQTWEYSGIDSIERCLNKTHFNSYPYQVEYKYNSRGFRDAEWPVDLEELKSAVWCVGDSFTVGLGSPLEHTWPYLVSEQLNCRTINVSMDGASNEWIARKSLDIINTIKPASMVIQWSYVSRREKSIEQTLDDGWQEFYKRVADPSWPACLRRDIDQLPSRILEEININHGGWRPFTVNDEMRRLMSIDCTDDEDIINTNQCIHSLSEISSTNIIHSFIPNFEPYDKRGQVESQCTGLVIPVIQRIDIARDGHHYDILTAKKFSADVRDLLVNGRS